MENNFANIKNPEELKAYIQKKVEEEIAQRHADIEREKSILEKQKTEINEQIKRNEAAEKNLDIKAEEINNRIKAEIGKQESILAEKKKELDRKYFENEKQLERKFADKEKLLDSREKEIHKQAFEAEKRINSELIRREREIERKRIIEERKIPNIVRKAQEEVVIQKKLLEEEKRKIENKLIELKRKQKEISRREGDVERREEKDSYKDENSFLKNRVKKEEDDSTTWLTTYSDVITLLLTLFVFMFTIVKVDTEKMKDLQKAINIGLLQKSGQEKVIEGEVKDPMFASVKQKLQDVFQAHNISEDVSLTVTDTGVKLELASSTLYDLGSANIKEEIEPVLDQISGILLEINQEDIAIEVEGHTDNIPINTIQFPSNWELSASRATNIVKFFIEKGVDVNKLRASGFADTRPKVPNLDPEGNPIPDNQAVNRRVEIYIGKAR